MKEIIIKKLILLLGFILSLNIVVIAQEGKTVDSKEYFLSTRIKNLTTNTNKVRIAHKPIHRPTKKATTIEKSDKKDVMESANEPIGLGYTLYLRDEKDNGTGSEIIIFRHSFHIISLHMKRSSYSGNPA